MQFNEFEYHFACSRKDVHLCFIMSPGKMIFAVLEWLSPLQWVLNSFILYHLSLIISCLHGRASHLLQNRSRNWIGSRGVRVYPYPRVYPTRTRGYGSGRVISHGSGTGTTSTGTGIPGFTRKEHDFSQFWSENLLIYFSACFLNYLRWSNYSTAHENSILLGAYNRLFTYFFKHCFVDYKKHLIQYDMWSVMKSYGMDQKLIILIKAIYSETQLAVLVNGHLSEWFQMAVDNRQGVDPLLPHFICFVPGENNG